MIDSDTKSQIASRFSLPPPLVSALENKDPNPGLLATYGIDPTIAKSEPTVALTLLTHAVATAFSEHGSLEMALSHVFSGDPHAYLSPTSHVGGLVTGTLAQAATNLAHGWDSFTPASTDKFGALGKEFGKFLQETRRIGGPVDDHGLAFWNNAVSRWEPQTRSTDHLSPGSTGTVPTAPVPKGPSPKEVENFAGEMVGHGIDVDHFLQHFPTYSALRYKLLSSKTNLGDYAQVKDMRPHEMIAHVRSQPHPVYHHLTAGEYADMHDVASLHSLKHQGVANPPPYAVSRLASAKAKWSEIGDFFRPATQT